jgi:hypothetical protein
MFRTSRSPLATSIGTAGAFSLLMDSANASTASGSAASALRVVARSFLSLTGSPSIADPEACTVGGAGRSRAMKDTIMGYRAKTRRTRRLPSPDRHRVFRFPALQYYYDYDYESKTVFREQVHCSSTVVRVEYVQNYNQTGERNA